MTRNSEDIDKEILDRVEKRAHDIFLEYHACSQCSLLAIQEVCDLKDDILTKASVGLSGGVGGMGSVCGALTGSALALGIKYGRDISAFEGPADKAIEIEYAALEPVLKLAKWFEREFKDINCFPIQKQFMGTNLIRQIPWQKEWAEDLGMRKHCAKIVARTARRAAAMLQNPDIGILDEV